METDKKKIDIILIEKGMTRNDLARRLGISRQALWARLSGSIRDLRTIEDVAEGLGVDVKELFA